MHINKTFTVLYFDKLHYLYLLLTEGLSFSPRIYGPSAKQMGHKSERKKRSVTYSKERENEVSEISITSLSSKRRRLTQTFEFSGPYSRLRPAKLTNHRACTN